MTVPHGTCTGHVWVCGWDYGECVTNTTRKKNMTDSTDQLDVAALRVPDDQVLDPIDDHLTDADLEKLRNMAADADVDTAGEIDPAQPEESGDDRLTVDPQTLAQAAALISVPKASGTVAQMAARAVAWFISKKGIKENPAYSNHIFVWSDVKPGWQGEPYCAAGVTDAWARQGVDLRKVISNPYYCPNLEAMAKSYGAWQVNNGKYSPRAGDISLMGRNGYAQHTGLAAPTSGNYSGYRQIEANTSSGNGGSQTNGDGIYLRYRDSGFIRGWINMAALIPKLQAKGLVGKASSSKPSGGGGTATAKPRISFAATMAYVTGGKRGTKAGNIAAMQRELHRMSCSKSCPLDSKWSGKVQTAYAGYQRAIGYRGKDADGIPGYASWARLMKRTYTPVK